VNAERPPRRAVLRALDRLAPGLPENRKQRLASSLASAPAARLRKIVVGRLPGADGSVVIWDPAPWQRAALIESMDGVELLARVRDMIDEYAATMRRMEK
jgi:hypothetical protein